ncbi:MAG: SDR family oxidoreductase [Arenicellales bacterium WSBS_2016_MAG_OTU3]
MNISLKNKTAVVTAGASGIGLATVMSLRAVGARVAVCDINEADLAKLPADVQTFVCDVSSPDQVDTMMQTVVKDGLDILVNNAGIAGPTGAMEDVRYEDWRQTITTDLDSQFLFSRRAIPVFKKQCSGVIINLTSTAGIMGFPLRAPYAAAKWAVVGLTKTLAMELGPHNIRVNAIAPGAVTGDRMDKVVAAHAKADDVSEQFIRDFYAKSVSMQTFVDPEEIAETITFLCSHQARHISGQILGVDGHTETLHPRV